MRWSLVVAVNNDEVLQSCLLRSPDIAGASEVILKRGFVNAGQAYNSGLDESQADIVILPHQDVYLPKGWIDSLLQHIDQLTATEPDWAVLGVFGLDLQGKPVGHVYSTGLKRLIGRSSSVPLRASTIDEMVIVLRRTATRLRFDPLLPGFHLYGTDICLEAIRRGLRCFVVSNLCVHNSNGLQMLPWAFWQSYWYLRKKWHNRLPVSTPCVTIQRSVFSLGLNIARGFLGKFLSRSSPGQRVHDPSRLYEELLASQLMDHALTPRP